MTSLIINLLTTVSMVCQPFSSGLLPLGGVVVAVCALWSHWYAPLLPLPRRPPLWCCWAWGAGFGVSKVSQIWGSWWRSPWGLFMLSEFSLMSMASLMPLNFQSDSWPKDLTLSKSKVWFSVAACSATADLYISLFELSLLTSRVAAKKNDELLTFVVFFAKMQLTQRWH